MASTVWAPTDKAWKDDYCDILNNISAQMAELGLVKKEHINKVVRITFSVFAH